MTSLVYVYAILPAPLAADVRGIGGGPVRWLTEGSLAAAVSDVPGDEFGQEALNESVRDMAWLGPRAVAHQEVNSRLDQLSDALLPLAFGTVFRDDGRVRDLLREQQTLLRERLGAVTGRSEWVVAVHRVAQSDTTEIERLSPALQALHRELDAASPGRAHLLRRRLAELERDELRRIDGQAAEQGLDLLGAVADRTFAEPLPSDTLDRPLLRASVLVKRAAEQRFLDLVEDLRRRWPEPTYQVMLTGPWPPYRFGGLAEGETRA